MIKLLCRQQQNSIEEAQKANYASSKSSQARQELDLANQKVDESN